MLRGITDNLGTIVISAILIAVVTIVIAKRIRDRKKGRSSCGCGCSSCAMKDSCHTGKRDQKEQRNEK